MSAEAADDLSAAGYTNVIDLAGGMNAWAAAGDTLLDDPGAAGN
jgi:rhodanese-related sulfurtransferase